MGIFSRKFVVMWLMFMCIFFYGLRSEAAQLLITDQSSDALFETEFANPKHLNVLQILNEHVTVKTKFGGAFVSSLSGFDKEFKEREGAQWFYYVNGIMSPVGAVEYHPTESDHIWWDCHGWGGDRFLGAVVGAYPEPFVSGYGGKVSPTVVWAAQGFEAEAQALTKTLSGFGVTTAKVSSLTRDSSFDIENSISICIGPWAKLEENNSLADMFKNGNKLGIFFTAEDGKIIPLNWNGGRGNFLEKAGIIFAAKSAFQGVNPVWFITGTDESSTREALDLLLNHPDQIKKRPGIFLAGGAISNVPLPAN